VKIKENGVGNERCWYNLQSRTQQNPEKLVNDKIIFALVRSLLIYYFDYCLKINKALASDVRIMILLDKNLKQECNVIL